MNSWQGTMAALALLIIGVQLTLIHYDLSHIVEAIDMGKFMPFFNVQGNVIK